MDMKNFRKKVRDYYKPYYENGDEAHLIEHADSVCDLALSINKECDEKLIILASYMHDMFNAINRAKHNELAYEYALKANDKFLKKLSKEELLKVAHALLEHRASFKGDFYSPLSEIISSADRELPNLELIVIRCIKFNNNIESVHKHIKEKYGTNGYANYPKLYRKIFDKELNIFKKEIDNLSIEKILEFWENRNL